MNPLDALKPYLFLIKAVLFMAAIGAVVALFLHTKHKYDDSVKAPLLKEITLLEDLRKADASAAQKESAERQKREDEKSTNWSAYARSEQEKYEALLAAARANKPSGVYHDASGSCGGAKEEGTGSTGLPQDGTTGCNLSRDTTETLWAEAGRADIAAIYAKKARDVALKCIAELSAK